MLPEIIIALRIWIEARGEPVLGKYAVATVIYNRSGHKRPHDVCVSMAEGWQTMTLPVLRPEQKETPEWKDCLALAQLILSGTFVPLSDWTHFYNPDLASPAWASKLTGLTVIGRHTFGRMGATND